MAFRRRRFRRRFRRRRFGGRRRGRSSLKKLIRRVVAGKEETKVKNLLGVVAEENMSGTTMYVLNPTYQVTRGTQPDERVGRKITNVRARLSFEYYHIGLQGGLTRIWGSSTIRLLVLKSKAIKTAGVASTDWQQNPASLTRADVFFEPAYNGSSAVDRNRWTVVMDRSWTAHTVTDISGNFQSQVVRKSISIPIGSKCTYRDALTTNSFLTGAETYVVMTAHAPGGGALDIIGLIQPDLQLRWKDG